MSENDAKKNDAQFYSVGVQTGSDDAGIIDADYERIVCIPSVESIELNEYHTQKHDGLTLVDEDEEDFNLPGNPLTKAIDDMDQVVTEYCSQHKRVIKYIILCIVIVLYLVYFAFAMKCSGLEDGLGLFVMTICAVVFALYKFIQIHWGAKIYKLSCGIGVGYVKKKWMIFQWIVPLVLVALLIVFAALMGVFQTMYRSPAQLKSAFGMVVLILFSWVFSKYPGRVQWNTVFWGMGLQLFLGIFILRTTVGFQTFKFLGDTLQTFLEYTDVGSIFVFNAPLEVHFFAFKVLPVIIFASFNVAILQYTGILTWIVKVCAWIMQYTMGISGVEAISAAANVFLGMTTVPIMVKPYLKDMTSSELHCLITGGFATIAGSVLGAYISFGISAAHLLSASVISAPAAIAVSKIFYPETKRPKTLKSDFEFQMPQEKNIMEAMANAVQDGLKICAAVAAQLIAIIAELAFLDAVLAWLGALVNYPELTFSLICRYLLYPTSWLMGVDTHADCHTVAELVGTKTFANEFVAYGDLSVLIKNRETGLGPTLTVRSEVIATYALCGFSNLGSIGVMIGSFGPIASDRKAEVAILCLRAIVAATVACLLTGCIAGLLYDEGPRLYVPDSLVGNMTTAVY